MQIIHPKLIEWNLQDPPHLDTFQNDDAIIDFLELRDDIPSGDHKVGYAIELNKTTYFGENATPFSCKNITIKIGSSSENHTMTLVETKRVKTKDVSNGENLSKVLEDGRFDILPFITNHERSSILIEETKEVSLGAPEKFTHTTSSRITDSSRRS